MVFGFMTNFFDSYSKNNVSYLLAGFALFSCTVLSGGLNWHGCVISLIILTALFCVKARRACDGTSAVLLLLLISSCVSLFWTRSNVQNGIYEFVKFLCFICAAEVAKMLKDSSKVLKIIYFNSLVVAVFGLFAMCGIMNANEFTFYDGNVLRLQSFIKYANSTSCFLGCGYISFLELFRRENKRAYLFGGGCILIALYFTFSKACIPIFLLISIVYLFFNRAICTVFLHHNIIASVALCIMLVLSREKLWFLLFAVITVAVVLSGGIRVNSEKRYFIFVCIAVPLILAFAIVVIALVRPSVFYTFAVRLTYMKDSLKLVPGHLFFGNGFGSWRVLQYAVQTTQYNVTYLHNGILQMLVENGAVFTFSFLALCVYSAVRSVIKREYVFPAITSLILLHSLLDCDLSFGALLIIMGFAVGISFKTQSEDSYGKSFINRTVWFMVTISLVLSNSYALTEFAVRSSFENAYISGNYVLAEERLKRLLAVCPLDADLRITCAALREKNGAEFDLILSDIDNAVALSPCEPGIYEAYMNYNLTSVDTELECEKYLDMAPKQERTYVFLKQYLLDCVNTGKITKQEYLSLCDLVENRRIIEKVIDRNILLSDVAGIDK